MNFYILILLLLTGKTQGTNFNLCFILMTKDKLNRCMKHDKIRKNFPAGKYSIGKKPKISG